VRKLLIAGIGNVLLSDDGIGPFVIKMLEARYEFAEEVELADLGTPALDLPMNLDGADAVILIDSARFGGAPGDIRLFRKDEILRIPPRSRIDPHSPALRESLSQLELMGKMPNDLVLIGIQGSRFGAGSALSPPVRQCVPHVIDAVLREVDRLKVWGAARVNARRPGIWWDQAEAAV
jgi:hydrogenase maturation protease